MRLLVDHYVSRVASLGSPGVDEVRWRKPVRPGDTLSVRVTVIEAKLSRSKPDQGTTRSLRRGTEPASRSRDDLEGNRSCPVSKADGYRNRKTICQRITERKFRE